MLAKMTLELVSACPSQVYTICEYLVKALACGAEDAEGALLLINGQTFKSRSELKAECQQLLRRYADNSHLEEADARFVLELLSHHPRGLEKSEGCKAVSAGAHPKFPTRCFFVVRADGREDFSYLRCVDNAPTREVECQTHICSVLCAILQLHPAACEKTARSIEERFPPYAGRAGAVESHRNWARSILHLCSNVQQLGEFLLMVLIRRMVEIDATIHKVEEQLPDLAALLGDKQSSETLLLDYMAQVLDANMMLMFEFLQRRLTGAAGEAETRLPKSLLSVFEGTVLLTHRVRYVQFLWFYLGSLRPAWAEAFLSVLLQTAYSPAHGTAKRVISFAYLASFVARAQFLPTKYALRTAQYVSTFARESLQAAEFHVAKGEASHPQVVLFLSSVQALCYILCFCAVAFAEQEPGGLAGLFPEGGALAGAEAFTPVLESPCRPLARITRPVAREFCRSVQPHCPQLAAALRQQLRAAPVAEDEAEEPEGGTPGCEATGLDGFFPFDPYRLRHSSIFLLGIYRQWVVAADDSESEGEAPGGLQADAAAGPRVPAASHSGTEEEEHSDADFTDAADAAERGFVPSVGPSPAFRPRTSADMMLDVSPLVAPMETVDDDDAFALPQASIDAGSNMLHCLLSTPAYKAGTTDGCKPAADTVIRAVGSNVMS